MFRALRIALLLLVLATVAQEAWLARSRAISWQDPLRVAIYPINGDGSAAAARYVASLTPTGFASIERFFDEEARRYGKDIARKIYQDFKWRFLVAIEDDSFDLVIGHAVLHHIPARRHRAGKPGLEPAHALLGLASR